MITKKGIKNYLDVLIQADGFWDKLVILFYLIKSPIHLFNKTHSFNLLRPIRVKTEFGSVLSNNDIFSAVSLTQDFENAVKGALVLDGGAFIDVGANIGGLSFYVAKKYPKNTVVSVEPEEKNIETFKKNKKHLQVNNVTLVEKGCASKRGKLKLFIDKVGTGAHSVIGSGDYIEIEVDTIDHIIGNLKIKRVDLIKIDVEGAEVDVLEGARRTIEKHKPRVVFEALSDEKLQDAKNYFSKSGYVLKRLDKSNYVAEFEKDKVA